MGHEGDRRLAQQLQASLREVAELRSALGRLESRRAVRLASALRSGSPIAVRDALRATPAPPTGRVPSIDELTLSSEPPTHLARRRLWSVGPSPLLADERQLVESPSRADIIWVGRAPTPDERSVIEKSGVPVAGPVELASHIPLDLEVDPSQPALGLRDADLVVSPAHGTRTAVVRVSDSQMVVPPETGIAIVETGHDALRTWCLLTARGIVAIGSGWAPPVESHLSVEALSEESIERDRYVAEALDWVLENATAVSAWRRLERELGRQVIPRSVDVLLATRRPARIAGAVSQALAQVDVDVTVHVLAHGVELTDLPADERVHVHSAPANVSLGEVLNRGLSLGCAPYVAKMDDDDHYGATHLIDAIRWLEHGQGDVVGRTGHLVHDAVLGVTHAVHAAKQWSAQPSLPGATMVAPRPVFETHRFRALRSGEDSDFGDRVRAGGGILFSSHRYGFARERHDDHTASAAVPHLERARDAGPWTIPVGELLH